MKFKKITILLSFAIITAGILKTKDAKAHHYKSKFTIGTTIFGSGFRNSYPFFNYHYYPHYQHPVRINRSIYYKNHKSSHRKKYHKRQHHKHKKWKKHHAKKHHKRHYKNLYRKNHHKKYVNNYHYYY